MKELTVTIFAIPLKVPVKKGIFDYDPGLPGVAPKDSDIVEGLESGCYHIETSLDGEERRGEFVITSADVVNPNEMIEALCEKVVNILLDDLEDLEEPEI